MKKNPSILLGAATLVFSLACGESGSGTSSCDQLQACCNGLEDTQKSVCTMSRDAALHQSGQAERACGELLKAYKQQNFCSDDSSHPSSNGDGDDSSTGGMDDAGTKQPAGKQPAICADYLSCAASVVPEALPNLLTTYGPNGSCWTPGSGVASTCETACTKGLENYHNAGECVPDAGTPPLPDAGHPIDDAAQAFCNAKQQCSGKEDPGCAESLTQLLAESTPECWQTINDWFYCYADSSCSNSGCTNPSDACLHPASNH